MKLREQVAVGERIEIGTYQFTAENIIAFAEKFDPQYFHLDAEKAKHSVLGGLCASGWHVSAAMMKCNVAMIERQARETIARGMTPPKFGPSPRLQEFEMAQARRCRRHRDLCDAFHRRPADSPTARAGTSPRSPTRA